MSSSIIPGPGERRRSIHRHGGGFVISNRRNNTKATTTPFQFAGANAIVKHIPATSSITTICGSLQYVAAANLALTNIPTTVNNSAAATNAIGPYFINSKHIGMEPTAPTVPGAIGDSPHPNQVAIQNETGTRFFADRITSSGSFGIIIGCDMVLPL